MHWIHSLSVLSVLSLTALVLFETPDSTMDSIQNILRKTLENLTSTEFKNFKHHLKDEGKIPWGKLVESDSYDTVDLIVEAYTLKGSDRVVLRILKMMNLNQLAMDMEKELGMFELHTFKCCFEVIFNLMSSNLVE